MLNAENECKTFEQREAKYLPYHKKVEEQVEQSRQVKGERQSTIHNSSWYDWAVQVCDNVSSMFSYAWERKSALLLGVMLASARGLGADALLQHGGTTLALLDSSNATGLLPAFDWKGFNPADRTAQPSLEFNPRNVPPEILDHLIKVGVKNPEELVRNALAGLYESQEEHNKQMATLRERDQTNPEVLHRNRQALEVMSPADAPAVSFASEDTPPPPPPPEPSLKCLSVDSSYITTTVVDSEDMPGREMRLLEYLRVRNNCPSNSYETGFNAFRLYVCPPNTKPFRVNPSLFSRFAQPDTVAPGQEVPVDGSPVQTTYRCTAGGRSYSPEYLFDTVFAKGYASLSREVAFTSPFKFAALPGESSPPVGKSMKESSRARTALLWNLAVGIPLTLAPYLRWRD